MRVTALLFAVLGTVSAECPNACSGHGECGVFDQCSCFRNWQGNDCSERTCPFGHAHVDSPKGDLNMDGGALSGPSEPVIINSEVYPLGTTEQYPDAQSNEAHFYMECSNKGLCDRKSGECECFDGYDGSSCQRASCPGGIGGDSEQCSGHGTCHSISYLSEHHSEANLPLSFDDHVSYRLWDAEYTRGCLCDPPFSGPDCSARDCKYGVDPLYTSTGTALYQNALVVNSCIYNSGTYTTNGKYVSDSIEYVATAGFEGLTAYSGSIVLSGEVAWASAGAEIIAMGSGPLGCRYTVVGSSFDGTDTTLNISPTQGISTALDSQKCESNGEMAGGSSYSIYHVVNTFTLLFTDHHGEVYRTVPISAAVSDYSSEVEAALEGLPNNVISDVTVTPEVIDPSGSGSDYEIGYRIAFNENPGQLGALTIDSTPIRLGDTLQAGIECDFNRGTQTHDEVVYSSVGYDEIGEDSTAYSDYAGNVGFFTRIDVTDDASSVTYSGSENNVVYTTADMSGTTAAGDMIKIQNEVYVVTDVTPQYLVLNTHFNGEQVLGTSTPIYANNANGEDVAGVVQLTVDSGNLVLPNFAYSYPGFDSNGDRNYQPRADGVLAAGNSIRVYFDNANAADASTWEFDCIFEISSVTYAFGDSTGDDATNEYTYTITPANDACATLTAADTADPEGTGTLSAYIYSWTPSAYTNGMYADNTRIFASDNTASISGSTTITAFVGADAITIASDVSSWLSSGDTVIYGNEINVVSSVDTTTVYLKNAYAWETSGFQAVNLAGYDVDSLYKVDLSTDYSNDYTYVSQCSNRGLCDESSGICKCFKGYTGDNCDTISELYG